MEYTPDDVRAQKAATQWTTRTLSSRPTPPLPSRLDVPVIVIQGRHDLHTPYEPAREFVARLQAPRKRFVTMEWSAHVPMLEEPGRFLAVLVKEVGVLAGGGIPRQARGGRAPTRRSR